MNIILHVGSGRTGTSAFQYFMENSVIPLVFYPRLDIDYELYSNIRGDLFNEGNGSILANALHDESISLEAITEYIDYIMTYCASFPEQSTVIISSENFWWARKNRVEHLLRLLESLFKSVLIIGFIRDPVTYVCSVIDSDSLTGFLQARSHYLEQIIYPIRVPVQAWNAFGWHLGQSPTIKSHFICYREVPSFDSTAEIMNKIDNLYGIQVSYRAESRHSGRPNSAVKNNVALSEYQLRRAEAIVENLDVLYRNEIGTASDVLGDSIAFPRPLPASILQRVASSLSRLLDF